MHYLLEPRKREKLANRLQEQLLLGQLFAREPRLHRRSADIPSAGEFSYLSEIAIDPDIYWRTSPPYRQDRLDGSTLHTEFSYKRSIIPNAITYSNFSSHRSVFDSEGRYASSYSSGIPPELVRRLGTPLLRHIDKYIPGTTLNLFGTTAIADGNYGHWLIDGLGRYFLEGRLADKVQADHYLVPRLVHEFQWESLEALGIERSQVIEIAPLEILSFEQLICTSAPRGWHSGVTPGWLVDDLRTAFLTESRRSNPTGMFYISRLDANSRKFSNEMELVERLHARGIESVRMSTLDFQEKIALFSQAKLIIGLCGAGMTNVAFAPKDTSVLELLPSRLTNYFFSSMSTYLGQRVEPFFFSANTALSRLNRYYGKFEIDIDALEVRIDTVLNNPATLQ